MQISTSRTYTLRQFNQLHHRIYLNNQSLKDHQSLKARQLPEVRHYRLVDYQQVGVWINGSTMVSNTSTGYKVERLLY